MSLRGRRIGSINTGRGWDAGMVKVAVLMSLALFFIFLIFTMDVQQTKAADCDCGYCHGDNHHGDNWSGCSGCHDSPPQTGTHLTHYNSAPSQSLKYGDTTVTSTADAYKFGCGNCHPLDKAKHRDGILQVELYHAAAPADSLKAKNPSSASYAVGTHVTAYASKVNGQPDFSYSDGTCSNVYCHSGYTVTSGPVGNPICSVYNSSGRCIVYALDADGNLTYDPYTVTKSSVYKTTPPWGTSGSFTLCTECHAFPLTTSYPSVQAGVGDSHAWIDNYGYVDLHAWNMGSGIPVSCKDCHYGPVTEARGFTYTDWNVTYAPVPLASRVLHVNGRPDVNFDNTAANNPLPYYSNPPLSLSGASYDPSTKTCSNVSCHLEQSIVKWGTPYRWWDSAECNICHGM